MTSPTAALVTGGAGGIGLAVVSALRAAGAQVVAADLDEAGRGRVEQAGGVFTRVDVTDPSSLQAAVAFAEQRLGRLDLVHLNAGVTTGTPSLEEVDLDRYRRTVAVNLDGVVYGVRAALPALRRAGGGAIVATASLSGLTAYPGDPVYAATKHAVVGLVRAIAEPLSAEGITVACICPGFVDTAMVRPHRHLFEQAGFPLLAPDDVAAAVLAAAAGDPGAAWVVQPGRPAQPYRFRGVPGPRVEGHEGQPPPSPVGE